MSQSEPLLDSQLAPILKDLVAQHQPKVVGWMRDEPGCWGFLAGQAVRACRESLGRSLSEPERRLVWDRLWRLLLSIRQQVMVDLDGG